jgi:hypothetical protein
MELYNRRWVKLTSHANRKVMWYSKTVTNFCRGLTERFENVCPEMIRPVEWQNREISDRYWFERNTCMSHNSFNSSLWQNALLWSLRLKEVGDLSINTHSMSFQQRVDGGDSRSDSKVYVGSSWQKSRKCEMGLNIEKMILYVFRRSVSFDITKCRDV